MEEVLSKHFIKKSLAKKKKKKKKDASKRCSYRGVDLSDYFNEEQI